MKDSTSRYGVAAVDRAILVLEAFDGQATITLANLSRATSLSEATTLRYLGSLLRHGLVERDEESGQYRLGMRLFQLGLRARGGRPVTRLARPWMEQLHGQFEETVNLAMRQGDRIIIIDAIESPRSIRKGANVGEQDIWHASSLGKAILASLPAAEAQQILERCGYQRYTATTLTTMEDIQRELARIRQLGYSLDNEECEEGQRCIGAPIFDERAQVSYALSLSGPASRVSLEVIDSIAKEVRAGAEAISAGLGYFAPIRP